MRCMVFIKATKESEEGAPIDVKLIEEMGAFNDELIKAGIMLAAEGLHPSSKGARVYFSGNNRTVIDGPFAETKELIAGYWLWEVRSLEEAIEWVKRCPNPMMADSIIEIRPIMTFEELGDAIPAELREKELIQREAAQKLNQQKA
ncbi:MAG: YciI family protein [Acidobacteria bacterium]|nr:YciI family protein [Acidobacteriota bacterium]